VAAFIRLLSSGSQKTNRAKKLRWLLAVLFVSWFTWIVYVLLALLNGKRPMT
jgi:hypothetical protein